MSISSRMNRIRTAKWYEDYGRALKTEPEIITTNYGWVDLEGKFPELELSAEEEPSRYPLNLYAFVARRAGIEGKDVLEVGSGRGGGARMLTRLFAPASYRGVDRSLEAIQSSALRPSQLGLTFVHGDAERLPCEDRTFDVVLSVEAAHAYGSPDRFLTEAARVLRPNGTLSLADFGPRAEVVRLTSQLEHHGLRVLESADLTPGVVESIRRRQPQVQALAARLPVPLREPFLAFAAAEGSPIETRLKTRETDYFFVLAAKLD
ncbi:MAG: class I SAM-dependent methyltransferase [Deltaproteobacteria bacterium]|nr:class I SAM-dependent methyltransferase [Deltaproteobacteria bacterium]